MIFSGKWKMFGVFVFAQSRKNVRKRTPHCAKAHIHFPREEKIFPSGGKKIGLGFRLCFKCRNFAPIMNECKGKILIVDDNEDVLLSLNMLLKPWVEAVRVLRSTERVPEFVENFKPDVILLDMNFSKDAVSGEEGYACLEKILEIDPKAVVLFITAFTSTEKTVRAIKAGAVDFIPKPWDKQRMLDAVHTGVDLRRSRLADANARHYDNTGTFIGESESIRTLKEQIARVAATDANVLITGENGSGKDVVAHELHRLSARNGKRMVSIDMGCIPESLFESELFGHEKGAFTGATATKQGRVEEADGGTLFLDEIGNLSPLMQQKLLTMIEKREVSRVGSTKTRCIDVRIVAATNANLKAGVEAGTFRQDLLYRLNTIALHLPPLRERGEDILLLARHFMDHFARKYKMEAKAFSPQEEQTLLSYKWPGNVRELQHCMERWVIDPKTPLCKILQDEGGEDNANHETEGYDNPESHQSHFSLNLEELERQAIMEALKQSDGNLTQTAALLGITRYALYRKIDKYGLS